MIRANDMLASVIGAHSADHNRADWVAFHQEDEFANNSFASGPALAKSRVPV